MHGQNPLSPSSAVTLRRHSQLRLRALHAFVAGYPNREWEGLLHEEGCIGVRHRKADRDREVCRCDGDYLTTLVKRALR